jgi:hypothetical protein
MIESAMDYYRLRVSSVTEAGYYGPRVYPVQPPGFLHQLQACVKLLINVCISVCLSEAGGLLIFHIIHPVNL